MNCIQGWLMHIASEHDGGFVRVGCKRLNLEVSPFIVGNGAQKSIDISLGLGLYRAYIITSPLELSSPTNQTTLPLFIELQPQITASIMSAIKNIIVVGVS